MAYSNPSKVISGLTSFQQCMYVPVSDFNVCSFLVQLSHKKYCHEVTMHLVPRIPLIPIQDEEKIIEDYHNTKGRNIQTSMRTMTILQNPILIYLIKSVLHHGTCA